MVDLDALIGREVVERELRTALVGAATAVQFSFDRALAHVASPTLYPLPRRPDALERRMRRQLGQLSEAALGNARDAAMARLTAPLPERRAHYGRLADLDLRSGIPTADQVRALPRLTVAAAARDQLLARLGRAAGPGGGRPMGQAGSTPAGSATATPTPSGPPEWLALRAKRLHCITDTSERFRDEIEIAGVSTDLCSGAGAMLPPQKLGKWKQGQNEALSPMRTLAKFPLADAGEPVPFVATLVLAEADLGGGLAGHVRDLHTVNEVGFLTDVLVGAVSVLLSDISLADVAKVAVVAGLINLALPGLLPGLFIVLSAILIPVGIALLLDRTFHRLGDEIFNDVPVFQTVGPRGTRFPGRPAGSLTSSEIVQPFRGPQGNGLYDLTYDWAIVPA